MLAGGLPPDGVGGAQRAEVGEPGGSRRLRRSEGRRRLLVVPGDALTVDVDADDLVVIGMGLVNGDRSPYHFARTVAAVVRGKRCPVVVRPRPLSRDLLGRGRRASLDRSSAAWPWAAAEPCGMASASRSSTWWGYRGWLYRGLREGRPCRARGPGSWILDMAAELAAEHTDGAVDRVLVEEAAAAVSRRASTVTSWLGAREIDATDLRRPRFDDHRCAPRCGGTGGDRSRPTSSSEATDRSARHDVERPRLAARRRAFAPRAGPRTQPPRCDGSCRAS